MARLAASPPVRPGLPRHRRRRPREFFRSIQAIAWIAAAGVVAALVSFLVTVRPSTNPGVMAAAADSGRNPAVAATVGAGPGSACIFGSCATPLPAAPPARVRIPGIGVDSGLDSLDLDAHGQVVAPKPYDKAGWYARGVVPGDPGPALIAGHVDSWRGPGVFFRLRLLRPGDVIQVERGSQWLSFRVTVVEEYPKDHFPTDKVYQPTPGPELRVVTCGGDFDRVNRRYYDNIVVYAVLA